MGDAGWRSGNTGCGRWDAGWGWGGITGKCMGKALGALLGGMSLLQKQAKGKPGCSRAPGGGEQGQHPSGGDGAARALPAPCKLCVNPGYPVRACGCWIAPSLLGCPEGPSGLWGLGGKMRQRERVEDELLGQRVRGEGQGGPRSNAGGWFRGAGDRAKTSAGASRGRWDGVGGWSGPLGVTDLLICGLLV